MFEVAASCVGKGVPSVATAAVAGRVAVADVRCGVLAFADVCADKVDESSRAVIRVTKGRLRARKCLVRGIIRYLDERKCASEVEQIPIVAGVFVQDPFLFSNASKDLH